MQKDDVWNPKRFCRAAADPAIGEQGSTMHGVNTFSLSKVPYISSDTLVTSESSGAKDSVVRKAKRRPTHVDAVGTVESFRVGVSSRDNGRHASGQATVQFPEPSPAAARHGRKHAREEQRSHRASELAKGLDVTLS
jgi:hypothetical protein